MVEICFRPLTITEAGKFCAVHHLYLSRPVTGGVFALGAILRLHLVGACIWGRPNNQVSDDGYTIQGYRLATSERVPNLGSMMISRSCRIASLFGYRRAIAFCRVDFRAVQLRAAGFLLDERDIRTRSGFRVNRYVKNLALG